MSVADTRPDHSSPPPASLLQVLCPPVGPLQALLSLPPSWHNPGLQTTKLGWAKQSFIRADLWYIRLPLSKERTQQSAISGVLVDDSLVSVVTVAFIFVIVDFRFVEEDAGAKWILE
jgi:hypothetical protein